MGRKSSAFSCSPKIPCVSYPFPEDGGRVVSEVSFGIVRSGSPRDVRSNPRPQDHTNLRSPGPWSDRLSWCLWRWRLLDRGNSPSETVLWWGGPIWQILTFKTFCFWSYSSQTSVIKGTRLVLLKIPYPFISQIPSKSSENRFFFFITTFIIFVIEQIVLEVSVLKSPETELSQTSGSEEVMEE